MHTQIWAHRGSSRTFIENSWAAFKQAVADGAEGVELDVQRTRDGKLIVFHDEKLSRLTRSTQCVWEMNWADLKKLTLGKSNETIPSLEEVLVYFKTTDLIINLELKNSLFLYPGMEKEVFEMVKNFEMEDQVLYSSFNHESMFRMAQLAGGENCAILTSDIHVKPWEYLEELGIKTYHPMINSLQQKNLIKNCHKNDVKVNIWTADYPAHVYAALLLQVDAIITNEPKRAVELRKQFASDGGQKAVNTIRELGFSFPE